MLSLKDYSRTFRGVTTESFSEEMLNFSKSTLLVRHEQMIMFVGKFYYLLGSKGMRVLNPAEHYGVILDKIKELYHDYKRRLNDPEFQLKIRETYQRVGVFEIVPSEQDIFNLLKYWSKEVSLVIEKYTKTKECEICMEDRLDFLFVKCSVCVHDICGSCYPNLKKKCPFCRTKL